MTTENQSSKQEVDSKRARSKELSALMLKEWLAKFGSVYNTMPDEQGLIAYKETLSLYSAEQIDRGCQECLRRLKFFPKPSEIIDAIWDTAPPYSRLVEQEKQITKDEALEVLKNIRAQREKMFGKSA